MDTCKIGPGRYQYTAVDDCTRIRVLAFYQRRSAANMLLFLERVLEELPFPIQRIQTDRGRDFFALAVQQLLLNYAIKFRPEKPGTQIRKRSILVGDSAPEPPRFIALGQDSWEGRERNLPAESRPQDGARVASPQCPVLRLSEG
jgi:putative transposase